MKSLEDAIGDLIPDLHSLAAHLEKKIGGDDRESVRAWRLKDKRRKRLDRVVAVIEAYQLKQLDKLTLNK